MTIKRGMRFYHKYWINADKTPAVCTVTKVKAGLVYYRNEGGTYWQDAAVFEEKSVKSWCEG